jgi:hypothetical protein
MGGWLFQIACISAGERLLRIGEVAPAGPKASREKIDPNGFGLFIQLVEENRILVAPKRANIVDIAGLLFIS